MATAIPHPDPKSPEQLLAHKALVFSRMEIEPQLGETVPYRPHIAQQAIHYPELDDPWQYFVAPWGVRSGKTMAARAEIIAGLGIPRWRSWIVAPNYELTDRVFEGIWRQVVEREIYGPGSVVKKSRTSQRRYIEMAWGAFVMGKSGEAPNSLLGEALDFVALDECSRLHPDIWKSYIRQRLIDRKGRALFISTPKGLNWFKTLYLQGQSPEGRKNGWRSLRMPTTSNPYIDKEWLQEQRSESSTQVWDQEILAKFISFSGLIWPDFVEDYYPKGHLYNPNSHHVESFWSNHRAIDIGTAHPTACVWGAVNPRDWVHVYQEYLFQDASHEHHANAIAALTDRPIARTVISHDAKNRHRLLKGQRYETPFDIYRKEGVMTYPTSNNWHATVSRVTSYLRGTTVKSSTHPGVLISSQCPMLIAGIQSYTYKELQKLSNSAAPDAPNKKNDDIDDAFRFLLAGQPKYRSKGVDSRAHETNFAKRYGYERSEFYDPSAPDHQDTI